MCSSDHAGWAIVKAGVCFLAVRALIVLCVAVQAVLLAVAVHTLNLIACVVCAIGLTILIVCGAYQHDEAKHLHTKRIIHSRWNS